MPRRSRSIRRARRGPCTKAASGEGSRRGRCWRPRRRAARAGTRQPRRRPFLSSYGGSPEPRRGCEHRLAGVGRLEHRRVAGLLENLAHQPVDTGEAQLNGDRAVIEAPYDASLLARPAGPLWGDPDARDPRRADLAGPRPAVDVSRRVDLRARLEALLGGLGATHAVEAEMADVLALGIVGRDIPALAAVDQRVGLDLALGVLVLVLLVVVELEEDVSLDRARDYARDVGVVGADVSDLQALLHRVAAERGDDLLACRRKGSLRQVLADQIDCRDERL